MCSPHSSPAGQSSHPWPLIFCLVGVDYFSTLAYLPSIAVEAAGVWAPVAAAAVVLVTFLLAMPVYWYVVGRAPDGRGAAGLLEDQMPGWRGKLVVLTLLGFAAADFVITRSLSLADATVHLLHNPHGQVLLADWPDRLFNHDHGFWRPFESCLQSLSQPQVIVTLILSLISFAFWYVLQRGLTRRMLTAAAWAVCCYLALTGVILAAALTYIVERPDIWQHWLAKTITAPTAATPASSQHVTWLWPCLQMILWSFPQMALGLSGFEMIMNMVPRVRGDSTASPAGRIRNTRKLMFAAASLMALYLIGAVSVTTLLIPHTELSPTGTATHRALAYLAHGSPLAVGNSAAAICPLFGEVFGDIFDLASVSILCLAGLSVTMGLRNLLPHYLYRLGMDVHWAGRSLLITHALNVTILLVTVVFRASPAQQQWAYATSVLVLLTGAAIAASRDLCARISGQPLLALLLPVSLAAAAFFLAMTGLTVFIHSSGLVIALSFVAAIVVTSLTSRWLRCTELRFEGFEFADDVTRRRWNELCTTGPTTLVPHRPGLVSLADRWAALQHEYRLDPAQPPVFIEANLGDPSNFYQKPLMRIDRQDGLEVIELSHCVSISHVLAALCLELCRENDHPPEIIFGWSQENPLAANLNFLLLGEGNIPWMVQSLVRKSATHLTHQPRIRIG